MRHSRRHHALATALQSGGAACMFLGWVARYVTEATLAGHALAGGLSPTGEERLIMLAVAVPVLLTIGLLLFAWGYLEETTEPVMVGKAA